jgi:hypothetical protein
MFSSQRKDYLTYIRNSGKYQTEFIDLGFGGVEIRVKLFSKD